ncbi:MAG: alpha-keto acid decarboxylase family protein, partial [Gammaproteobacteria bacterium]|nr:alpha-keto acid decarboxylase family protein [Gammaproteobacteria bacterium]
TERFILDGPFNDIAQWRFHHVGDLVGNVQGFDVATEADFESAWQRAVATRDRPSLLNVHLAPDDGSPAMRRLAGVLREKAV